MEAAAGAATLPSVKVDSDFLRGMEFDTYGSVASARTGASRGPGEVQKAKLRLDLPQQVALMGTSP